MNHLKLLDAAMIELEINPCADILQRAGVYYKTPLSSAVLKEPIEETIRSNPDMTPGEIAADIPKPGEVIGCLRGRPKTKTNLRGREF
jgi:hypothetical protein